MSPSGVEPSDVKSFRVIYNSAFSIEKVFVLPPLPKQEFHYDSYLMTHKLWVIITWWRARSSTATSVAVGSNVGGAVVWIIEWIDEIMLIKVFRWYPKLTNQSFRPIKTAHLEWKPSSARSSPPLLPPLLSSSSSSIAASSKLLSFCCVGWAGIFIRRNES